jgi:acyl dehydratase
VTSTDPQTWAVRAQNLAEHAVNPIHTDAGAQAAGFPRALIAGVTTYAYLTHPLAAAWGVDWLAHGEAEVRFRSPVFLDDELVCRPEPDDEACTISGMVGDEVRVTLHGRRRPSTIDKGAPDMGSGEPLRTRHIRLDGEFGHEYGSRAGDDLDLYSRLGLVHPAVWPALANHLVHTQVARGSWIHTASAIRHHEAVRVGSTADVSGVVVRRFDTSAGERAVLDVRIDVDGRPVATIEHTAIVALPGASPR